MDVRRGDRSGIAGLESGIGVVERLFCSISVIGEEALEDFRRYGRTGSSSRSTSGAGVALRDGGEWISGDRRRCSGGVSRRGEGDCGTGEAERIRFDGERGMLFGDSSSE